jgi:serine-type D-Ala-D-Ala carboxypeptidase/endopeptidase
MMRRLAAAAVGLCLFGAALAQSQPVADPESMAREALGSEPGWASVALWRQGQLAQATVRRDPGTGGAQAERLAVSGPAPLFEIGSISKLFTGLLLAQAVERGELSLDDTLGQLLRGTVDFASGRVAAISLRQLVTHSSCLPRQFGNGRDFEAQIRDADRVDLLLALERQQIDATAPCPALYSNYGIALLAEVLVRRYDKPWELLVRERITEPLAMRDTRVQLGDQSDRLVPAFSGPSSASAWPMKAFAGAGGLRASAQDMVVFGRALLQGRAGPLGPAAERLLTPLGTYEGREIGYAVFIHGPPERRTYSHDGLTGGYRALLTLSPDNGEVLVALVSNRQAPLSAMAQAWWARRYPVSDRAIDLPPSALAPLAGVYRADNGLALTVTLDDGRLYVRSRGGVFRAYIAVAPDSFTRPAGGARVDFAREGTRVTGLTLEQAGNRFRTTRTTQPVPEQVVLRAGAAQAFVGHFVVANASGPKIAFDVRDEHGQLMVRSTRFPWEPVLPIPGQVDRFRYDNPEAELQFERDVSGRVVALVLHQRGTLRALRTPD